MSSFLFSRYSILPLKALKDLRVSAVHQNVLKVGSFIRAVRFSSGNNKMNPLDASHAVPNATIDPHAYTAGRWLRVDTEQRIARYIEFNYEALAQRVIELCPGASSIETVIKKEGGFNRVFIFSTDNDKQVVARLPFSVAGPPKLTTNSEVATITYLQKNTTIPIPRILDWSDDAANHIGSEYIIMEPAFGVSLRERWPSMSPVQQINCVQALFKKLSQLNDLEFTTYGSLYFADATTKETDNLLSGEFALGPHCGRRYWDCYVDQKRYSKRVQSNIGPWNSLPSFADGLIDVGISMLPLEGSDGLTRRFQGSIEDHLELLKSSRDMLRALSMDVQLSDAAKPLLLHPDLNTRNVFVSDDDPTLITSIIDWQSSSIEPAFWYANETPDFATLVADPAGEGEYEAQSEHLHVLFDGCIHTYLPAIGVARKLNQSIFRPFRYAWRTWEDSSTGYRQELIETSQEWNKMGLSVPCPYRLPSETELAVHKDLYRFFEASLQVKDTLMGLVGCGSDGYVETAAWDQAQERYKFFYEGLVEQIQTEGDPEDPLQSESDLREIWPFDLLPKVSSSG